MSRPPSPGRPLGWTPPRSRSWPDNTGLRSPLKRELGLPQGDVDMGIDGIDIDMDIDSDMAVFISWEI